MVQVGEGQKDMSAASLCMCVYVCVCARVCAHACMCVLAYGRALMRASRRESLMGSRANPLCRLPAFDVEIH